MDLKPCPFCGGKAKHFPINDFVYCEMCGAECPSPGPGGNPVQAWNTRPPSATPGIREADELKEYRNLFFGSEMSFRNGYMCGISDAHIANIGNVPDGEDKRWAKFSSSLKSWEPTQDMTASPLKAEDPEQPWREAERVITIEYMGGQPRIVGYEGKWENGYTYRFKHDPALNGRPQAEPPKSSPSESHDENCFLAMGGGGMCNCSLSKDPEPPSEDREALSLEEAIDMAFSHGIAFALSTPEKSQAWADEVKAGLVARAIEGKKG